MPSLRRKSAFSAECGDTPVTAEISVLTLKERQFNHSLHFIGVRVDGRG
jgi:hypothetical protein